MNAPRNTSSRLASRLPDLASTPQPVDVERPLEEDEWFVDGSSSGTRPTARPKSSPPTGDDEVDRWLK